LGEPTLTWGYLLRDPAGPGIASAMGVRAMALLAITLLGAIFRA
jgi:hypothetical protein